ncbi:hypothetical protein D9M68_625100 [compost metagenome]
MNKGIEQGFSIIIAQLKCTNSRIEFCILLKNGEAGCTFCLRIRFGTYLFNQFKLLSCSNIFFILKQLQARLIILIELNQRTGLSIYSKAARYK